LWDAAGLRDVRSGALRVHASYTGFEELWAPFPSGVGPSGAFCAALDEPGRVALHEAYRRALGVDDQPFRLSARAWAVKGTVA
jgi:hypothetical protein